MNQADADEDIGVERGLLGYLIIDPEVIPLMIDFLQPEDFSLHQHQTIYETMVSLTEEETPCDFITLADELEKCNKLDEIGGASYLTSLIEEIHPSNDILTSARTIERLAKERKERDAKETGEAAQYNQTDLTHPETRLLIAHLSPSFRILEKLLDERGSVLDHLHWREFEELIADLLEKDGYVVTLGRGTKDGGQDIIAMKELDGCGWFMSVWQAKKLKPHKKVELSVIRELADTSIQHKASKAMIVTSTYLTRGALERVNQDQFILGKVDRDDLMRWFQRVKRR